MPKNFIYLLFILIVIISSCSMPGIEIKESVEQLKEIAKTDPNDCVHSYNLGVKYLSTGEADSAMIEFDKAIKLNPHFSLAYFGNYCAEASKEPRSFGNLIDANVSDKESEIFFDTSKTALRKAFVYDPYFDWKVYAIILKPQATMNFIEGILFNYIYKGIQLFIFEQYDESIKELTEALEIVPNYYRLKFFRGLSFSKTKQFDSALCDFKDIIDSVETQNKEDVSYRFLNPADYYYIIGYTYLQLDSLSQAEEYFQKTIMNEMSYYMAHFQLSNIYNKRKQFEEAATELDAAILLEPNDAVMHYNKAVFLAQMKKTEQAIQSYKKSIEINPYYTKSYFNLALIYESKGKKNEAIDCYKKFIQYSPKKFKDYISQAENKIQKLTVK